MQCPELNCPSSQEVPTTVLCNKDPKQLLPKCSTTFHRDVISWTDSEGETVDFKDISDIPAGDYELTASYNNEQCVTKEKIKLSQLAANLSVSPAYCVDSDSGRARVQTSGNYGQIKYLWSNGQTESSATNLTGGKSVSVNMTDELGCNISLDTTVPYYRPIQIDFNPRMPLCNGDSNGVIETNLNYDGDRNIAYQWSTGSASPTLSAVPAGSYGLKVTDQYGCSSQVNFQLQEPKPLDTEIFLTDAYCIDGEGLLELEIIGGTAPYSISRENRYLDLTGGDFAEFLSRGLHEIEIKDKNGCFIKRNFNIGVTPSSMNVSMRYDGRSCKFETIAEITSNQQVVHQEDVTSQFPRYTPDDPMNFNYNFRGCQYSSEIKLSGPVPPKNVKIYIPNAFSPNRDGINYTFTPLPELGKSVEIDSFRIFNRWGGIVYQRNHFTLDSRFRGWDDKSNGTALGAGVYVYMLTFPGQCKKPIKGSVTLIR